MTEPGETTDDGAAQGGTRRRDLLRGLAAALPRRGFAGAAWLAAGGPPA